MFPSVLRTCSKFSRGVLTVGRQSTVKPITAVSARFMSEHKEETDEEFYSRYEAYFNRSDIDGWEARKAMNDLAGQDAIAEPKVIIAALKACRRLNDYAMAIRFLESVKIKSEIDKSIYPYILQEISPTLQELGIDTPEALGYDKPELALDDVDAPNYAALTLLVFLLPLVFRPLSLILFLCIFAAWIYFVFSRDEPITLLDYDVDQKIVMGILTVLTLVSLFWAKLWLGLFISFIVGALIVLLHGALRTPEDSMEDSPYGSLLDSPSPSPSPRGEYASV